MYLENPNFQKYPFLLTNNLNLQQHQTNKTLKL